MAKIEDVLARRTDPSTFLVHLCRDGKKASGEKVSAKQRLKSILKDEIIRAVTASGPAVPNLKKAVDRDAALRLLYRSAA